MGGEADPVTENVHAASVASSIDSTINASSFVGLLTHVELGLCLIRLEWLRQNEREIAVERNPGMGAFSGRLAGVSGLDVPYLFRP
jgi:hypothetical protein